jgi:hypothetical protein
MIAKVETKDKRKLGNFIENKVRPISGILDTKTLQ